jgi:hypothetical protein
MGGYTMEFHVELKHGVYPELGGQGATTSISEILCFAKIRVYVSKKIRIFFS